MMLSKKVKEIMTTEVITTTCDVDVVCAFEKLMKNKNVAEYIEKFYNKKDMWQIYFYITSIEYRRRAGN